MLNISYSAMPNPVSFRYFKTSSEIIQLAVRLFGGLTANQDRFVDQFHIFDNL